MKGLLWTRALRQAPRFKALLLVLMVVWLVGCGGKEAADGGKAEGVYQVYYLNSSVTRLEPQDYTAQSAPGDTGALIQELKNQLLSMPNDLDCQTPVPDKVTLERFHLEDRVLYLYFDNNYALMEPAREVLCRAAFTKTLTQIEGVDYISIYTADQPLMDASGTPVGIVSAGDFVDNISNVNAFEKTELTLYFADAAGEKLVEERREVVHNVNTSLEKLVIEQLIAGPDRPGLIPTLPKGTKLLNVSVTDNVCYINFDSAFLNSKSDVKEYIPIYSIVNSLAEAASISKVQIAVNGSQDVMFRDSIPLNTMFERNLDYNVDSQVKEEDTGGTTD